MGLTVEPEYYRERPIFHIKDGLGNEWAVICPEMIVIGGKGFHQPRNKNYAGVGSWAVADQQHIQYTCSVTDAPAHDYRLVVSVVDDKVAMTLVITNKSGEEWPAGSHAIACMQQNLAPDYMDQSAWRTFVGSSGKIMAVGSLVDPWAAAAPWAGQAGFAAPTIDKPYAARVNKDGRKAVAMQWTDAPNVTFNFNHGCIHSNPSIGPLAHNQPKTAYGWIWVNRDLREIVADAATKD